MAAVVAIVAAAVAATVAAAVAVAIAAAAVAVAAAAVVMAAAADTAAAVVSWRALRPCAPVLAMVADARPCAGIARRLVRRLAAGFDGGGAMPQVATGQPARRHSGGAPTGRDGSVSAPRKRGFDDDQ